MKWSVFGGEMKTGRIWRTNEKQEVVDFRCDLCNKLPVDKLKVKPLPQWGSFAEFKLSDFPETFRSPLELNAASKITIKMSTRRRRSAGSDWSADFLWSGGDNLFDLSWLHLIANHPESEFMFLDEAVQEGISLFFFPLRLSLLLIESEWLLMTPICQEGAAPMTSTGFEWELIVALEKERHAVFNLETKAKDLCVIFCSLFILASV